MEKLAGRLIEQVDFNRVDIEVIYHKGTVKLYAVDLDMIVEDTEKEMTEFIEYVSKLEFYQKEIERRWGKNDWQQVLYNS